MQEVACAKCKGVGGYAVNGTALFCNHCRGVGTCRTDCLYCSGPSYEHYYDDDDVESEGEDE